MSDFGSPVPILNVKNVTLSIRYYVEKLGLKKDWDSGTPPTFASISRGKTRIFLCQGGQGHSGTWMWIPVPDVDALHEELKSRGVPIRQPPTNFPWGSREMNIQDPDGHRLRFGSESTGEPDGTPLVED
jgi:catechol 2,3-dioxygenase-like lactoylglutathione lyase family enzyme